ncbi:MAG TPA: glycosyltransferase [Gemmataceae bacterium]|nr:glycosyltransferase [Gemmataceae bacterium]
MTGLTSLVLPTYNPGPAIERTWAEVERFLAARSDPWEAVFVLDGCTDGTPGRLARLARTGHPRVCVVGYPTNRGKGFAVRTGLLAARGAVRVFTDVDLAYPFDDIVRVADTLRAGAAVAVACRDHPDSRVVLPPGLLGYARRRHFQSRIFGALARRLLPITQRDTQAGLKGMTAAVARSLVPQLGCDGFGFDCELLTACAKAGVPVAEVPVSVRYDTAASTTGLRATARMLRELWQIRRAWRNRTVPVVLSATVAVPEPTRPRVPAAA